MKLLIKLNNEENIDMLVFEFIANVNNGDKSWMNFLIEEVITKNKVLEILGENSPKIIKSASVVDESSITKGGETKVSVQYDPKKLSNGKETREYKPLVKIYTTMPGLIVDELRSFIKRGIDIEKAVNRTFMLNRTLDSTKKRNELTVLGKIFSMKPNDFDYLVVKC